MEAKISDIYGYTVFANIDNRKGNIYGYQVILNKEQMEAIEEIILSSQIKVMEEWSYEVENDKQTIQS